MKLYVKQKVLSLTDQFSVKDEAGNDKYIVKGELLSLERKLHMYNLNNQEVALVKKKLVTFLPKFVVLVNNVQIAEIAQELTLFNQRFTVKGLNWVIKGDLMAFNIQISKDNVTCVSIHKKWMSWGDSYEIDINTETDEIIALAVTLAIDCVMENYHKY